MEVDGDEIKLKTGWTESYEMEIGDWIAKWGNKDLKSENSPHKRLDKSNQHSMRV